VVLLFSTNLKSTKKLFKPSKIIFLFILFYILRAYNNMFYPARGLEKSLSIRLEKIIL